jgi:hypothetical protein
MFAQTAAERVLRATPRRRETRRTRLRGAGRRSPPHVPERTPLMRPDTRARPRGPSPSADYGSGTPASTAVTT